MSLFRVPQRPYSQLFELLAIGRITRRIRSLATCGVAAAAILIGGCERPHRPPDNQARALGVDHRYATGHVADQFPLAELVGGGVAAFDHDRDGDIDLLFNQGPGGQAVLFENTLDGGELGFRPRRDCLPLSEHAGMGWAVGDVNNDGWDDVYLTQLGPNQLWINRGGCFVDGTEDFAAMDDRFSTSATFVDIDLDGWLDLFIANYVELTDNKVCRNRSNAPEYCGPESFPDQANRLFRNRSGKGFSTIEEAFRQRSGASLGVIAMDANSNNRPDLIVANDGDENELWLNFPEGFDDYSLMSGIAVNANASPEAGMGIAIGDIDLDGDEDLLMTHLAGETHTLYTSEPNALFRDATKTFGMDRATEGLTGFGVAFVDLNGDGLLDLYVANGAVQSVPAQIAQGDQYPYRQKNQYWLNSDGRRLVLEPSNTNVMQVSRGLASADLDNDGDRDLVVINLDAPAEVLTNRGNPSQWLGLELRDNHDRIALGAKILIECANGESLAHTVRYNSSYLSASDPRFVLSLQRCQIERLSIQWPSGHVSEHRRLEHNRYQTIHEPN